MVLARTGAGTNGCTPSSASLSQRRARSGPCRQGICESHTTLVSQEAVVGFGNHRSANRDHRGERSNSASTKRRINYSVTGSGTANDITYDTLQEGNGQNGEAQVTNVALPWSKTIQASGLVTAFTLSATVGSGGGSVTCTITEDGKVVNTNTATEAFATATCNH